MRSHIIYANAHIRISILINMRGYTRTHTHTNTHTLIYLFNIMQASIAKTVRLESCFYIFLEFQWGRQHAYIPTNASLHTHTPIPTHTHTHTRIRAYILFRTTPLYIHLGLTYFWTTVPAEHNEKTFYLTS